MTIPPRARQKNPRGAKVIRLLAYTLVATRSLSDDKLFATHRALDSIEYSWHERADTAGISFGVPRSRELGIIHSLFVGVDRNV